ncbi:MAG: GNAT family N-acetyltransferase [Propionibacteriaceae bacterium]|jgi:GNAT superfamily N-acetyltransferase|nr:GNAT family N-acetyltransferase [Propionibacteriaceae bacterium]
MSTITPTPVIRPAQRADWPALGQVLARAYSSDHPVSPDYLDHLLHLEQFESIGQLWAAWLDQELAGGYLLIDNDLTGYVERPTGPEVGFRILGVDPPWRGRGVARALLDHAVDWGRGRGAGALAIYTAPHMLPAHRLYESYGFSRQPQRDSWVEPERHPLWAYHYPIPEAPTDRPGPTEPA